MVEIFTDGRSFATFISAIVAFCSVIYSVRVNMKHNELKINLDQANLELNDAKNRSEENHRRILFAHEVSGRLAEETYQELTDLRDSAAILFASIQVAEDTKEVSNELIYNAVLNAKKISLFYPPGTTFQEELNIQIETALSVMYGRADKNVDSVIAALRLNVWSLINLKTNELKEYNGRDDTKSRNLEPYKPKMRNLNATNN